MKPNKNILIAVDGSSASRRTTAYVANMAAGGPDFRVGLLHLELPPRMLEWGGSEDPEIEERVSNEREQAYREMEEEVLLKGQAVLQRLQRILSVQGVEVFGRFVQFEEPMDRKAITQAILKAAAEHECGTVVVGRHSFTGWRTYFLHHLGEELIREGKGIAVWVVE
jgi:nucleotide-binding universal stress UspA family protein